MSIAGSNWKVNLTYVHLYSGTVFINVTFSTWTNEYKLATVSIFTFLLNIVWWYVEYVLHIGLCWLSISQHVQSVESWQVVRLPSSLSSLITRAARWLPGCCMNTSRKRITPTCSYSKTVWKVCGRINWGWGMGSRSRFMSYDIRSTCWYQDIIITRPALRWHGPTAVLTSMEVLGGVTVDFQISFPSNIIIAWSYKTWA